MSAITVVTEEVRQRLIGELTQPGGLFEVAEEVIRGVEYRVFNNSPRNLREMYALGMARDSFYAKALEDWFGDEDFLFIVYRDERYTFRETYNLAARLSWQMKARYGITKGDRVAIAMRNYPEFCLAFMACTAIGALAVPLNAWWEGPELDYALRNSEPKLIFADQQRADRMIPFLNSLKIPLVVARPEGVLPDGSIAYSELIAGSDENEFPPAEVHIDDDAFIMYTSGSTGRPKGVVATHRAIITTAMTWQFSIIGLAYLNRNCLEEAKPLYKPATLLPVPLFHVTGLLSPFFPVSA